MKTKTKNQFKITMTLDEAFRLESEIASIFNDQDEDLLTLEYPILVRFCSMLPYKEDLL